MAVATQGSERTRPTVVLACAAADAPAIAGQLRHLVDLGVRAEIVAGVDLDARPLELQLEGRNGRTAYAICCSDELDTYQTDLLQLTIRAAEVDAALVWTVPFQPTQVESFIAAILERLQTAGWLAHARPHAQARRRSLTLRGVQLPGQPVPPRPTRARTIAKTRRYLDDQLEMPGGSPPVDSVPHESVAVVPTIAATSRPICATELAPTAAVEPRRRSPGRWVAAAGVAAAAAIALISLGEADEAKAASHADTAVAASAVAGDSPRSGKLEGGDPSAAGLRARRAPAPGVHGALAAREIRAINALLVADPQAKGRSRREAAALCASLERAGRDDWRLPTASELRQLAEAGLLPGRSAYWLGGKTRKPKASWNGKKVRARKAKRRSVGRAMCVASV